MVTKRAGCLTGTASTWARAKRRAARRNEKELLGCIVLEERAQVFYWEK